MLGENFEHGGGTQIHIVDKTAGDIVRLPLRGFLRSRPHAPALLPKRRPIGRKATATRETDFQLRKAVHDAPCPRSGYRFEHRWVAGRSFRPLK
jgi:hypothetical protein